MNSMYALTLHIKAFFALLYSINLLTIINIDSNFIQEALLTHLLWITKFLADFKSVRNFKLSNLDIEGVL